jgi:hypothetical protein
MVERETKEARLDLEEARQQILRVEMHKSSLEDFMTTREGEEVTHRARIRYMEEEKETLLKEMEAMRLKHERDRTKLRFYKNEYTGFEVAKRTFEEDRDKLYKEVVDREKVGNELKDQIKRLEEQYKLAEQQVTILRS